MGQTIYIPTEGVRWISAYRADPPGLPLGGIVVVQEIFGVNPHIRRVVDGFAARGYAAIAPAVFDHVETGVELGYDAAGIEHGRALAAEVGFASAVTDVASAAVAIAAAGPVGVAGYCWGGSVAYLCAARLGLPAVSYYGARTVPLLGVKPRAPLMLHFGEKDPLISPEDVQKHREALPGAEIHVYPAGHGFNCDARADHEPQSAALALERTLDFFTRHFGTLEPFRA